MQDHLGDTAESPGGRQRLLKQRAAALSALSASLFVNPDLHDAFRTTGLFVQLRDCDEGLRSLDAPQAACAVDEG